MATCGTRFGGAGAPPPDPAPLRRMPPERYRDFLAVGAGGMGVVYRAHDTELDREVALKVVRPAVGTGTAGVTPPFPGGGVPAPSDVLSSESFAELRRRFLDEARITASLAHPGVVPVHEVGETAGGAPYYAMRFVEGHRTLADAIAETRGRTMEERLRLLDPFLRVCDTVRYAHARGVVHRDLKPANVALGEYGEVIVLDWGIARVRGGSAEASEPSSPLGTPGYMSPEAARGEMAAVDERSDVYALGAVLLEILTGREPPAGAARLDVDPDAPADLVALCRAALEGSRERRLPDVDALAHGVRAWQQRTADQREADALVDRARALLAGAEALPAAEASGLAEQALGFVAEALRRRPEHASAEEVAARARELRERVVLAREARVRRRLLRRGAVAALAVTALASVGVAWALEVRRAEADELRALAQGERRRAEDSMTFMLSDLRVGLEALGRLDLLSKAAELTRRYYETLPAALTSRADRERRIAALGQVGDVLRARGDLGHALTSYRAVVDEAEGLLREDPDDTGRALAATRARAQVGRALFDRGERSAAYEAARAHLVEVERLRGVAPDDRSVREEAGAAHAFLGDTLLRQGDDPGALAQYRAALRAEEEVSASRPDDPLALERAVRARVTLARWTEDPDASLGLLDRALADANALAAKRPGEPRWRHLVAETLDHRLAPLSRLGRDVEVRSAFDEASRIRDELERLDPTNASWREARMRLHLRMADALSKNTAATPAALEQCERAAALAEELVARDAENAVWLHQLVNAYDRLGFQRRETGDVAGALRAGRRAYEAASRLRERDEANVVWRHIFAHNSCTYGNARSRAGEHAEAVPLLTQGLDLYERLGMIGTDPSLDDHMVSWAARLAASCAALGDRAGEEAALRRALQYAAVGDTAPRSDARWRSRFAGVAGELARVVLRRDPTATGEARALYSRAVDALRPAAAAESPPGRLTRDLSDLEAALAALPDTGR